MTKEEERETHRDHPLLPAPFPPFRNQPNHLKHPRAVFEPHLTPQDGHDELEPDRADEQGRQERRRVREEEGEDELEEFGDLVRLGSSLGSRADAGALTSRRSPFKKGKEGFEACQSLLFFSSPTQRSRNERTSAGSVPVYRPASGRQSTTLLLQPNSPSASSFAPSLMSSRQASDSPAHS